MSIQLVIIALYFVLTILIGVYAKKKSTSATSFHGAGLGILMCVAAGTGEWLGGTSTTGIAEYGFTHGISGAWYSIANGIGVIVLAIFFAKLYRSLDTVTVPGIIEKYIGVNARVVASVLLTFVMIAVGTAQIIAAGTLGVTVLGLDFNTAVIIMGIGFIAYTLVGGMNSVGYTNIMHLICMYGGMILALFFVSQYIGGLSTLTTELPADPYFKVGGIGWPKVSSWVIASVLGACTAQAGIQPILAAKDANTAKKAAFLTALVVAPFGILTALLGMAAKVSFPELANAKLALPTLMMNLNPVVGGIVLASVLAAVLSTISPIILASGTMFTKDIYQRVFKPQASDQEVLFVSRLTTGLAGAICIVLAILFYGGTAILDIVYFAYSIRGALFVVLLFAIYWKFTSQRGGVWAMVVTGAVGLFWVVYKAYTGSFPFNPGFTETYAAVIAAAISTVVLSLILPDNGSKTRRGSS
ncbi:MAG: sodium:solute symporter family protein [Syntrophaceticus sp.]|jgi:SSS family solute:Na+ symporter